MTKLLQRILFLALVSFLGACSIHTSNYAAISDRPMTLYDLTGRKIVVARDVDSSSSRSMGIIIPVNQIPSLSSAITQILDQYDGDYIANATVSQTSFHIIWLYHYSSWKINGDIIRLHR